MAKQLYDYWFVQFDFPDENGKPYKSSGGKMVWNKKLKRYIPKGWEVHSLAELGNFKNGINYSKGEIGDRKYKIINVRNISSSSIFIDNSDLDELTLKISNGDNYLVCDSDILIARSGTPGSTRLLRDIEDNIIYCGFIICYTLKALEDKNFLFYSVKQLEVVTKAQSNGSILSNINQDVLKNLLVSVPPIDIKKRFNEKISTVFTTLQNNLREIDVLTKQRDELLPLLMNGQVKVGVERSRLNYDLSND
jgi:type I restriction enzyme S subunit